MFARAFGARMTHLFKTYLQRGKNQFLIDPTKLCFLNNIGNVL